MAIAQVIVKFEYDNKGQPQTISDYITIHTKDIYATNENNDIYEVKNMRTLQKLYYDLVKQVNQ